MLTLESLRGFGHSFLNLDQGLVEEQDQVSMYLNQAMLA